MNRPVIVLVPFGLSQSSASRAFPFNFSPCQTRSFSDTSVLYIFNVPKEMRFYPYFIYFDFPPDSIAGKNFSLVICMEISSFRPICTTFMSGFILGYL
jgi:hypothetical protein